jgi:hypothetical protein
MILSKAREIRAADPRLDGKGHKSITLNGVKLNSMQGVCSCEFCVAMDRKELEQQNA